MQSLNKAGDTSLFPLHLGGEGREGAVMKQVLATAWETILRVKLK